MDKDLQRSLQNLDVNCTPLSDTILSGNSCSLMISLINMLAVSTAEGVPIMGRKWAILERQSTATKMVVNPSEGGKSTKKVYRNLSPGLFRNGQWS